MGRDRNLQELTAKWVLTPGHSHRGQSHRRLGVRIATILLALSSVTFVMGVVGVSPAAAVPTTVYVAQGGSNSNTCLSGTSACATITHALSLLAPGAVDTIDVTGTVTDNVQVGSFVPRSNLTIEGMGSDATVDGNLQDSDWGSVFTIAQGSHVTIEDLTISMGLTPVIASGPLPGGGVFNDGYVTLTNDTITNNDASGAGGGLYNSGTAIMMEDTISGNSDGSAYDPALPQSGGGGGIFNAGTLELTQSTVSGNTNWGGPGAGIYSAGPATLTNDTINHNSISLNPNFPLDTGEGGGIYNASGVMTITLTTIAGDDSGGTGQEIGDGASGSGIATAAGSTTDVAGSIIADDVHGGGVGMCDIAGTWNDLGYNILGDYGDTTCTKQASTTMQNTDPQLGSLQNNGGLGYPLPTFTQEPTTGTPGSPAIDEIPMGFTASDGDLLCPGSGQTLDDQRGVSRPQNADNKCDIGSVEVAPQTLVATALHGCQLATGCSPSNVNIGKSITVVFHSCVPYPCTPTPKNGRAPVAIDFYWNTTSAAPFAVTTLKSNGSATVKSLLPPLINGVNELIVEEPNTGITYVMEFVVSADVSLGSKSAEAGTGVNVTLSGFDADSPVTLSWNSPSGPVVGTVTTNSTGSSTGTFTVPPVADGTYTLYAEDSGGASAEATYVVTGKAPVVRGVSPDYGAADTTVTITGANLNGALAVDFGSSPALSFEASATSVTAVAPPGEALAPVTVTTPVGESAVSAKDYFDYAPTVTGIAPKKGTADGGTAVIITGTNLLNATAVDFGLTPATGVTVISATQIAASSPGGTGTANVTVTNAGGTSPTSSKDQFTYTGTGAPAITSDDSATFTDGTNNSFMVTTAAYPVTAITESGNLPNGVSFVDNGNGTATLSGTPAPGTEGSYPITITAANGVGTPATQVFTLIVGVTISSVTIGGTQAAPTIIVTGSEFGTEAAIRDTNRRAQRKTAPLRPETTTAPTSTSGIELTPVISSAGLGPPNLAAVGVNISSYSNTQIVYTVGSCYGQNGWIFVPGDSYTMYVLGASYSGTVSFDDAPLVTEINPDSGPTAGGTPVTITGVNLSGRPRSPSAAAPGRSRLTPPARSWLTHPRVVQGKWTSPSPPPMARPPTAAPTATCRPRRPRRRRVKVPPSYLSEGCVRFGEAVGMLMR